jgi:hypothetical protein
MGSLLYKVRCYVSSTGTQCNQVRLGASTTAMELHGVATAGLRAAKAKYAPGACVGPRNVSGGGAANGAGLVGGGAVGSPSAAAGLGASAGLRAAKGPSSAAGGPRLTPEMVTFAPASD